MLVEWRKSPSRGDAVNSKKKRKGGGIAMVMLRYDRKSCMNPDMVHKEPKKPALYARMLDPVWITATSRAESSPFAVDSHFLLSLIVVVVFYTPSLF